MTEILIASSVLILALLLIRKLFSGSLSRRVQYALWALVLVRLLLPVQLPAMDFSVLTAAKPVEKTVTQSISEQPIYVPVAQAPLEEHPTARKTAPEHTLTAVGNSVWIAQEEQQTAVEYKRLSPYTVLSWVWIAGSCAVGAFLLFANLRFWLWLRRVRKPYEVKNCKLRVYLIEAGLPSPCLFGLFRPAIYLTPAALESETRLRHVLAHELTHARHLDHLWTFLRGVCLAVYWFDPLVWVAAAAVKTDCELACDEGALARLEEADRIPYGKTLLSLIPVRQAVNPLLAATAMTAGKRHLKDRFTRIAKRSRQTVAAVVAVAVLVVAISACTFTGGNSSKLVICFDTPRSDLDADSFLHWLDLCGKALGLPVSAEDVELELIPGFGNPESTERSAALQRLRTEIMAGKGPDLFICTTMRSGVVAGELEYVRGGLLFPSAEKMRDSGTFLPLDDELSNLTLSDVNDLIPQVLEGGKNQNGELVILPLMFTVPGVIYADEVGRELPEVQYAGTSWEDVLKGDDPLLREQVNWFLNYFNYGEYNRQLLGGHSSGLFCLIPQVADFENEALCLSEEELTSFVKDSFIAYRQTVEQGPATLSASVFLCPDNFLGRGYMIFPDEGNMDKLDLAFAPLRNLEGGSTAVVTQYCAVNANTKRKDKALAVIDALLNREHRPALFQAFGEMPIYRDLSSFADPQGYIECAKLSKEQYQAWQRICEDINIVRFPSPLDAELDNMMTDVENTMMESLPADVEKYPRDGRLANCTISDEKLEEIVSEHYKEMQKLLDES